MNWTAITILTQNKNQLIDDVVNFVKINHPIRTTQHGKCARDTGIVIDAYISGIKNNTDMYMQNVCNNYYKSGVLQLKSTDVEVLAHEFLFEKIHNLVYVDCPDVVDILKTLNTMLLSCLKNGPITTPVDLISLTQRAEHCQRNWDFSKPVISDHINMIVDAATNMPTKQNRPYYRLVCSTNLEFNRFCYDNATYDKDPSFKNNKFHRNGQVNAPLLLMWTPDDEEKCLNPYDDDYVDNFHLATGISSGAAAFAAGYLGYSTGFCICVNWPNVYANLVERGYPTPGYGAGLLLGIGHPDDNYKYNDVVIDGIRRQTVATMRKNIIVDFIK